MNTSKSLHDLVYATKVLSNKTKSGYEVTFDPDYLFAAIVEAVEGLINGMYELSLTDLELEVHNRGCEIPVISKTDLMKELHKWKA